MNKKTLLVAVSAFVILLSTFFYVYLSINLFDSDFWGHLATGKYIVETGTIPDTDPFSFTADREENQNLLPARENFILKQYWLGQIICYLIFDAFGPKGIIILRASILFLVLLLVDLAAGKADFYQPRSIAELDRAAQLLLENATSSVLLVGGDGTIMAGLTALDRAAEGRPLPTVTLAHAGTVGTVARSLGFRVPAEQAVVRFCAGCLAPAFEQPTLRATDDAGDSRVVFIFGTGLVANFFEKYDDAGGGLPAAAAIVARLFAGSLVGTRYAKEVLTPMPCRLSVDGELLAPPAWGVSALSPSREVSLLGCFIQRHFVALRVIERLSNDFVLVFVRHCLLLFRV